MGLFCYNRHVLRRERGHKRTSAVKYRKAVQSNIRPKPTPPRERFIKRPQKPVFSTGRSLEQSKRERVSNPGLRATLRREWRDMIIFGQIVKCGICDYPIKNDRDVSLDHIIPRSKGGGDIENNMQPTHKACNCAKGSLTNFSLPFPAQDNV